MEEEELLGFNINSAEGSIEKKEKINQDQLYELLTGKEISWQAIIYDLINSEQLDPWDINLGLLANKYLEKIRTLEEANFFVSSKVLLAAALLLRLKSEILLSKYIKSIDEILFGKKEEKKYVLERIQIDENELPELVPKTPLPRYRKVSLDELMKALDKAINTETRRIRKEISDKQAEKLASIVFPKTTRVSIKDRIRKLYARIQTYFKKQHKISYTELVGEKSEERLACFLPILHLDNQEKVWLNQERHFQEIYIWLKEAWRKENADRESLMQQVDEQKEELDKEQKRRVAKINKEFENPLADFFSLIGR
jgi:segregation and condensation protein A